MFSLTYDMRDKDNGRETEEAQGVWVHSNRPAEGTQNRRKDRRTSHIWACWTSSNMPKYGTYTRIVYQGTRMTLRRAASYWLYHIHHIKLIPLEQIKNLVQVT